MHLMHHPANQVLQAALHCPPAQLQRLQAAAKRLLEAKQGPVPNRALLLEPQKQQQWQCRCRRWQQLLLRLQQAPAKHQPSALQGPTHVRFLLLKPKNQRWQQRRWQQLLLQAAAEHHLSVQQIPVHNKV